MKGAAHAGREPRANEQGGRAMTTAPQVTSWDAKGAEPSVPARAKADAAGNGDGRVT